ncbi:GDP-mannose 4,6-dehydratase [Desulfococcaceae bacterium OttesenSCG-928-F15]|nr:GDP-mannose 4,6-dehydratase [Desulfococcaceae bacterium OttesenSCG-928-F15]
MADSADKRVLITGLASFTGRYMTEELLTHGYTQIFGLGFPDIQQANYYPVDLRDLKGLKTALSAIEPDIVIHLAARAFVADGDTNAFYQTNLMGTRNLLEAISLCKKHPESILLVSSANIYGNASEGMLNENTLPNPANDYAVSKLSMEYMAGLWAKELPVIIVRPFNYTGVGQTENFLIPKIVSHFRKKASVIELGNIDVSRDFSDVRSVVEAYRRLIEKKPHGETFTICSGIPYTIYEIIALCEKLTNHKISIRINPDFVRKNEVKILCGDNRKLQNFIGEWQNPPFEQTLNWMLE